MSTKVLIEDTGMESVVTLRSDDPTNKNNHWELGKFTGKCARIDKDHSGDDTTVQ